MNFQSFSTPNIDPSKFAAKKSENNGSSSLFKNLFHAKPKFKVQTTFSNFNREAKQVFVSQNEMNETLQVQHQKTLSESATHVSTVSHGIGFGSKGSQGMPGMPPDYVFSANYRSTKGNVMAQITSNRLYFASMRMKLGSKSSVESTYQSQSNPQNLEEYHSSLKTTYEYKGYDYRITSKVDFSKGALAAAYMQQLSEFMSAGLQAQYNIEQRKSSLASVFRYFVENKDNKGTGRLVALETKMEDGQPNGAMLNQDWSLKATYHDDVAYNIRMCAELMYNFAEREAKFKYGFMHSFFDGKVRACIDQDWNIQAVVEHKLTPQSQIAFCAEANPQKAGSEFKFGVTVQYAQQ